LAAVLADELSDAEATRRVLLTAGGLVLIGVLLLIATVWWWRATRPDHPVLGPLEVMSDRGWVKAGVEERRRLIESNRPSGSLPAVAEIAVPEPIDLSVLVATVPPTPDDLAELDLLLGLVPAPRSEHVAAEEVAGSQGGRGLGDKVAASIPSSEVDDEFDAGERGLDDVAGDAVAVETGEEPFESEPAHVGRRGDRDGSERAVIDPLLQRTIVVAKD
jgi:hypothetical protein